MSSTVLWLIQLGYLLFGAVYLEGILVFFFIALIEGLGLKKTLTRILTFSCLVLTTVSIGSAFVALYIPPSGFQ
jgi:hypothetical protein